MWKVKIREIPFEDGDSCGFAGCSIGAGERVVLLEVNGRRLLEMCRRCADEVGQALRDAAKAEAA